MRRGEYKLVHLQEKEKCVFGETSSRFTLQSLGLRLRLPMYIYMNLYT